MMKNGSQMFHNVKILLLAYTCLSKPGPFISFHIYLPKLLVDEILLDQELNVLSHRHIVWTSKLRLDLYSSLF